ncbi:histidine N-acetyltransferase-like isoform X2 [Dreissena polymorpha]|uniref:histidine N-acetyltransferase-like isoform X2 n=1 Tax=Dreissena polymorpha TaxID=45954 RepID=UPI002264F85E|nr:histidine N-acetyltransferase-like isoform X2 [Dreissena polymorpha]
MKVSLPLMFLKHRSKYAGPGDKQAVLSLRQNVYRGLDYLPDYYDYFIADRNRKCIIGEMKNKPVVFGVMYAIDGGRSMIGQAGRVHERFERQGLFSAMNQFLNAYARSLGCRARVAMVETTLNMYTRSEKFKQTHTEITSKLHYAGVITHTVRDSLQHIVSSCDVSADIRTASPAEIQHLMEAEHRREYLFPNNSMLLDYIPYQSIPENIPLLFNRNVQIFSNVCCEESSPHGLLTAGSNFLCSHPPESYTIDVFGTDSTQLENHILFHLHRALQTTHGEFCLQIFVEKGYMAQELCNILVKLDIPKCNWYVEGGVAVKSIVEERL